MKNERFLYILFFVLSVIFLIINSTSTSPFLFRQYNDDSPIFMSLGKFLIAGKIPYLDYFDHKGPVIIFIQAIAASLCMEDVRNGAFIIQIFNLFFTLIIIYKTCKLFSFTLTTSLSVVILFLVLLSRLISGGNDTEEYCLILPFLVLYYTLNFIKNDYNLKPFHYFIIGVSLAFTFWIRANNATVVVACILFISIMLIIKKHYKKFGTLVLYSFLGFASISLLIIAYFAYVGALYEMIDGAFISNFQYLSKASNDNSKIADEMGGFDNYLEWLYNFAPFITLILGTVVFWFYKRRKDILILSACLCVICYFSTQTGHPFFHYTMLCLPCFILGLILLGFVMEEKKLNKKISSAILVLSIILLCGYSAVTTFNTLSVPKNLRENSNMKEIINRIPTSDYNSVFTYKVGAEFYLLSDIYPYNRYYILQEWQAEKLKRENILTEINEMMVQNPPKWFVIDETKKTTNNEILDIINNDYTLELQKQDLKLYKRKVNQL